MVENNNGNVGGFFAMGFDTSVFIPAVSLCFNQLFSIIMIYLLYVFYLLALPFIYSLFWAVLIGQALFPSKAVIASWIERFCRTNGATWWQKTPLLFRFPLVIPMLLDRFSDKLVDYIWRSKKNIVYIVLSVCLYSLFQGSFLLVLQIIFVETIPSLLEAFRQLLSAEWLSSICAIWLGTWILFPNGPIGVLYYVSCGLQFVGALSALLFIYKLGGYYLAFLLIVLTVYGYIQKSKSIRSRDDYLNHMSNISSSIIASPVMEPLRRTIFRSNSANGGFRASDSDHEDVFAPASEENVRRVPTRSVPNLPVPRIARPTLRPSSTPSQSSTDESEQISIIFVFILLGLVLVWENPELLMAAITIISVAIAWSLVKMLIKSIFIYSSFSTKKLNSTFRNFLARRKNNSIIIEFVWDSFREGNAGASTFLVSISSHLASFATIVISLVMLVTFLAFMMFQIYSEAQQFLHLFSELTKQLVSKYPTIENFVKDFEVNAMIEQGFCKVQSLVLQSVHKFMAGSDDETIEQTKSEIKKMFDKLYLLLTADNKDDETSHKFWEAVKSLEWVHALNLASQNINMIQDYFIMFMKALLFNSILLISNISDYIYITILFFVALYNALSHSIRGYRPVELLMSHLPTNEHRVETLISRIQNSVVQVFYVTFRLAIFYTVWTCICHKLVGTTLVFLPSIIGGILAVTPLLSPYMAYFIGMAELYLVHDQFLLAMVLFILGIAPSFIIDGQIYQGVDSLRSAYFTGLAVVGGGYLFGITGCLLGPLIVCIVIELVKFGSTTLSENREQVAINGLNGTPLILRTPRVNSLRIPS